MKKMIVMALLALTGMLHAQTKGKQVLTATFKVAGNCEQCKERIENAADIKGVKTSVWDQKTQMLKVVYRADKVSEQDIRNAIAKSGHDVEGVAAPDSAYKELPDCCKYRDKKCEKK
jgi:hypothetical protein